MLALKRTLLLISCNIAVGAIVYFSSGNRSIDSSNDHGIKAWRSSNCTACHSTFGLGGHIGPDLTNIYEKKGPEYIHYVLENGIGNMPKLALSEEERNQLVDYLKHLNTITTYPLKKLSNNPFGTNDN